MLISASYLYRIELPRVRQPTIRNEASVDIRACSDSIVLYDDRMRCCFGAFHIRVAEAVRHITPEIGVVYQCRSFKVSGPIDTPS